MNTGKTTPPSRPSASTAISAAPRRSFCSSPRRRLRPACTLLLCAGLALLLSSCLFRGKKDGAEATDLGPPPPPPEPVAAVNDYKIMPADVLEINVYQENDLKTSVRVSNEGTILFPLVGILRVGGLTTQQAAHVLKTKLGQGYLIDPQVGVTVTEYAKRMFTVLGEVQRPGSYNMPDQQEVTLLQALGMAGGYTRIANPSSVVVTRKVNGEDQTFNLNAKRMAGGHKDSVFNVLPGDVITVAQTVF